LSQYGAVVAILRHSLRSFVCVVAVSTLTATAYAQDDEADSDTILTTEEAAVEADTDGSLDDAEGSISLRKIVRGFNLTHNEWNGGRRCHGR
jgi:hypothetical protein